jgi:PKD repeat protein
MKTLKSLGLLLLLAMGVVAQPTPNDMFIDGYVLDVNGQAVANHEVCVSYVSNNPSLPSDTICSSTNANGYFILIIPNGSLTGPNVSFDVSTYDPCALFPVVQTVDNAQGTVNNATLTFAICANGSGSCDVSLTAANDSTLGADGVWTFTATPTGTAPFTYDWWVDGASYSTQTVTHTFNGGIVGVYVTVTDANGCEAFVGDTLYLDGNQNNCGVTIDAQPSPIFGGVTLTANPVGVAPFDYIWTNGANTQSTDFLQAGTYCVQVIDANGCQSDACYTYNGPNQGCSVTLGFNEDSLNNVLNAEVWANVNGVAPFAYEWSNGATTESIYLEDLVGLDTICVTITDAAGCVSTSCTVVGYEEPNQGNCFASFWYQSSNPNSPISTGDPVQFTYSGSSAQFNYYFWSVQGMGMFMNSYDQNPSFTFTAAGSYEVCVEVYDSLANCADTYCETIVVQSGNPLGCEAFFVWNESNIVGAPLPAVEFTDLSDGAVYWFWDFGDNTTSTEQNPLHLYQSAGTYGVCLTIVNADQSCQQSFCDTIVVGNTGSGNCSAAISYSGPTPIGYTFAAEVQDPNLYYYWEVDNAYVGDGYEAYVPGFSNGVHTICLTVIDSLNMCSDTECLTITVGNPNNCYGYISGQLYAGSNNQPLDEGVVYLITHDAVTGLLTAVDSMVVDSGNYYFFGPVACGDYMIKAAAYPGSQYYSNHIPTYYGNSPFWGFAQTISIGQANIQVSADITLIAASNPGGPGFIGGLVSEGANKMDEGDPVSGMQVNLFDLNGNAIAYTYTDVNGEFGFENLAYGTYQVYVEALGVQTIPAVVTIGPDASEVDDIQIWASESLITTGINDFDFEGAIGNVYPNPVLDGAAINFNLEAEVMVDISIVDLAGRTVSTETVSVASGENTLRIDADGLNEGYYFLNIQDVDGAFSITRKFMRVD